MAVRFSFYLQLPQQHLVNVMFDDLRRVSPRKIAFKKNLVIFCQSSVGFCPSLIIIDKGEELNKNCVSTEKHEDHIIVMLR